MKQKKEKTEKVSFREAMEERLKSLAEARRDKVASDKREQMRVEEDEVMLMTHGPNWRTRYAGEPEPAKEDIPIPEESGIQLKAS